MALRPAFVRLLKAAPGLRRGLEILGSGVCKVVGRVRSREAGCVQVGGAECVQRVRVWRA